MLMPVSRLIFAWFIFLACGPLSWGRELPVEVSQVRFDEVSHNNRDGEYLQIAVSLEGGPGIDPRYPRWNSPIEVELSMAIEAETESGKDMRFYRSAAKLVGLESGESATVFYYLPPEIKQRDDIDREPMAWLVRLKIGDQSLPTTEAAYARSLSNPSVARSYLTRMESEADAQDGLLLPIYLTPFYDEEYDRLMAVTPSFIRTQQN